MTESATQARSLRRNFSWSLLGQVIYAGTQWGLLVAIAKIGDPGDAEARLGQFALALALASPAVLFGSLQLRQLLATDADARHPFPDYLWARLISMIAVLGICGGLAILQRPEVRLLVLVVSLAKAVEAVGDIFHGLFQRDETMWMIARSQILRGLLSLLLFAIGMHVTGDLVVASLGLVAAWTVVLLAHDLPLGRAGLRERVTPGEAHDPPRDHDRWNRVRIAALLRRAAPLGLTVGLVSIHTNVPRYQMEAVGAERALGVFASISYVAIVLNLIARSIIQVLTPRFARLWADGQLPALRRLTLASLGVFVGLGALGWLLSHVAGTWFLGLLYTPDIARHADILALTVVVAAVSACTGVLRACMTAADSLVAQIPLVVLAIAITALVGWWQIPLEPLRGAIYALLAGRVGQALVAGFVVLRLFQGRGEA